MKSKSPETISSTSEDLLSAIAILTKDCETTKGIETRPDTQLPQSREGVAGGGGLLTAAGDGRQAQALTHCPDGHHPVVAREIPGSTEPRW